MHSFSGKTKMGVARTKNLFIRQKNEDGILRSGKDVLLECRVH